MKKFLFVLFIFMIIVGISYFFFFSSRYSIENVEIEGASLSNEQLHKISQDVIGKNIFLYDKKDLKKEISKIPTIETYLVQKKYPKSLRIQVHEHEALANVLYNGKFLVVSSESTIIEMNQKVDSITEIKGFSLSDVELGEKVKSNNPEMFNEALDLADLIQQAGIANTYIEADQLELRVYLGENFYAIFQKEEDVTESFNAFVNTLETLQAQGISTGVLTVIDGEAVIYKPFEDVEIEQTQEQTE